MQRFVARKVASISSQLQFDLEPELPLEEESVHISDLPFGLDFVVWHIGYFVEMDPFTFVLENECIFVQLREENAYIRFERRYLHDKHMNIFAVGLFRPHWRISWDGRVRMEIRHEPLNCMISRKDGGIVHGFLKERIAP